eukprot:6174181-Pleurochrysis_carterae.AAC.2
MQCLGGEVAEEAPCSRRSYAASCKGHSKQLLHTSRPTPDGLAIGWHNNTAFDNDVSTPRLALRPHVSIDCSLWQHPHDFVARAPGASVTSPPKHFTARHTQVDGVEWSLYASLTLHPHNTTESASRPLCGVGAAAMLKTADYAVYDC